MAHRLRLWAFTAESVSSIPGQETKILQAARHSQNKLILKKIYKKYTETCEITVMVMREVRIIFITNNIPGVDTIYNYTTKYSESLRKW